MELNINFLTQPVQNVTLTYLEQQSWQHWKKLNTHLHKKTSQTPA